MFTGYSWCARLQVGLTPATGDCWSWLLNRVDCSLVSAAFRMWCKCRRCCRRTVTGHACPRGKLAGRWRFEQFLGRQPYGWLGSNLIVVEAPAAAFFEYKANRRNPDLCFRKVQVTRICDVLASGVETSHSKLCLLVIIEGKSSAAGSEIIDSWVDSWSLSNHCKVLPRIAAILPCLRPFSPTTRRLSFPAALTECFCALTLDQTRRLPPNPSW